MTKLTSKEKVIAIAVMATLVIGILIAIIFPSLAYFREYLDKNGFHNVMVELIFDRLDQDGMNAYYEKYKDIYSTDGAQFSPGMDKTWGTRENPYVISQKYHVQNLSVLQKAGFFDKKDANGNTTQAYFLVCNPDGTPVVIDCNGMKIAPVGTHDHPFIGSVHGAPASAPEGGEPTYQGYGSSISGIANLTITATLEEPDIGFFGMLGYTGERVVDEETGADTVVGGYAASVRDLLLADVTIHSRVSLAQRFDEWWASLSGHRNSATEREETHHVGIIAGHAEFATIKDVSVYYREGVSAFDLVSSKSGDNANTNYYSTTGLIGLLDYVNPTVLAGGVLDGSDAVSDSDLVGDGSSGGGGDESGTMTGYFLAKNLYDRHESNLTTEKITGKYNVAEMMDENGDPLFETVTMAEGSEILGGILNNYKYKNYFYFRDTVFTFAMSMSVDADKDGNVTGTLDESGSDYVQRIWKLDEKTPAIRADDSLDDLQCRPDPTANAQIAYKLDAVTSLTEGECYILTYLDKGATDGTDDDVIYILNLDVDDPNGNSNGYAYAVPASLIYGDPVYTNGCITSMYLIGTSPEYYEYSFQYKKKDGYPITILGTEYKFGITASNYSQPTTIISREKTSGGSILGATAYTYNWDFTAKSDNKYLLSVTGRQTFGFIYINARYGWSMLTFENGGFHFHSEMSSDSDKKNETITPADNNYFTVYQVNKNTYDANGNISNTASTGNIQLTPKNITPDENFYTFDPSKYVLQYTGTTKEGGLDINNYKLAPIRSLKLNNGEGELLSEINHIVKLYKAQNSSYELDLSWLYKQNDGGVLSAPIGTTDLHENYTIPAGMIAFDIQEASQDDPSYINIIVAVNPEQTMRGTIGVWQMNEGMLSKTFNLDDPEYLVDSFELPKSITAKSDDDRQYIIKVSERVVEVEESGKRVYHVVRDNNNELETSYIYLGGETVLVFYTLEVDEPGVYLLGSKQGPLSVAYFSVTGAAGQGDDGMSGSPLGNVDFVYDYNGMIITTDKHYTKFLDNVPLLDEENYEYYHPSYLFVGMLPEKDQEGSIVKIQNEVLKIRRYIIDESTDSFGTRRHIKMTGGEYTAIRQASPVTEDYQDDID